MINICFTEMPNLCLCVVDKVLLDWIWKILFGDDSFHAKRSEHLIPLLKFSEIFKISTSRRMMWVGLCIKHSRKHGDLEPSILMSSLVLSGSIKYGFLAIVTSRLSSRLSAKALKLLSTWLVHVFVCYYYFKANLPLKMLDI